MLGVLWLDHDWLKERGCNPDLKCSNIEEREKLIELADEIMSCELPEESEKDPEQTMLRDFVLESQIHRHTDACKRTVKKKGGDKDQLLTLKKKDGDKDQLVVCRFGFPKLVSERSLLAIPIEEKFPALTEEEKKEKLKLYKEILLKVKTLLSNQKELDVSMSFNQFYETIGCSKEIYEEAISTTEKGNVLILKRGFKEIWINNYNPNWLMAWNANMDIQLAHDPYAVLTYIVKYVSKDESGMTTFLKDALRKTKHLSRDEQVKALKTAWLTHRQIGASETVYRLIPGLYLTQSNTRCVFVATGYPENRHHFFKKVAESENYELDIDAVMEEVVDYYSDHEEELGGHP